MAPAQGAIPNINGYYWYDPAKALDISAVLASYQQQPNCQFDMAFDIKYEKFPEQWPG